ncbi:ABC transporter ATP-binding protein [Candidatus Sumerlaeota bacterium]|nr:ABC transporter ATP-binding protein [Candidatus Sumerlaeota bacterium]
MRDLFRLLFPYCLRHKWKYVLGAATVVLSAMLNTDAQVWIGRAVDYVFSADMRFGGIWFYVATIGGLIGGAALAQYFQRLLLIITSRNIEFEMRNDFFAHLSRLSPSFYDRMKTGDIISRATTDIDQMRTALGPGIMHPIMTLGTACVSVFAMWRMSPTVTLICFTPMLILPILVRVMANLLYTRSLRIQEHFSLFSGRIQESIAGVRVVRSFVQEGHELDTLDEMNRRNFDLNMSRARIDAAFGPILVTAFTLGIILIIWVSSRFVVSDPSMVVPGSRSLTKGQLLSFVLLYRNLFWPLMGLGWILSIYQRAAASTRRLMLIWSIPPAIADSDETDRTVERVLGEIEFRDLTFAFPKTEADALKNVSFRLPAGKTLGIVGPVGSGKSTIAHLVARLYDPPAGTVFVDGRDVRTIPLDVLRQSIGMVFQETYLFSDTIAANICFGLRGETDAQKAADAARIASVDAEIEELPAQYESRLGERGVNLSGGQKQRVSLARAIACDPKILILDDAFASVDTHTEERILGQLRDVIRQRTAILISHRISTVQMADEIVVLDGGAIVQRGRHEDLVRTEGLYADIYRRQLLEEAVDEEEPER